MFEKFIAAIILTIFLGIMSRIIIGEAMKKRKSPFEKDWF